MSFRTGVQFPSAPPLKIRMVKRFAGFLFALNNPHYNPLYKNKTPRPDTGARLFLLCAEYLAEDVTNKLGGFLGIT